MKSKFGTHIFFITLALVLTSVISSLMPAAKATATSSLSLESQPNIILILTDDQPAFTICGFPDAPPDICAEPIENHPMPTVEQRLVGEGTMFTQAMLTQPFCCPARAAILSGGFYSHHTNVLDNERPNGGATRFIDTDTLPTLLQQNGYKTALLGKFLNGYNEMADRNAGTGYIPPGWDQFVISGYHPDLINYYEVVTGTSTFDSSNIGTIEIVNDGTHITDYFRDRAVDFIDQTCQFQSCDKPFFMFFSTHMPHKPATPAPRHANLFSDFLYRGRGWGELPDGDVSDKAHSIQDLARKWDSDSDDAFHVNQLRSLRGVDEAVAAIIAELEAKDILNNTIIIFSTDNGMMWGAHQLTGKDLPYEESLLSPLIIRFPGGSAQSLEQLVAADIDIPPTIFELAGILGASSDGMSLLPIVDNPLSLWRDEMLIQGAFDSAIDPWAGIRTYDGWKYIEYVTGEKELYDLSVDPFELESKHNDSAYAATMADLANRLALLNRGVAIETDWMLPTGVEGTPYLVPLSGRGGNGNYVWSVYNEERTCEGNLPTWLVLDANGTLSGTPTETGAWEFCIMLQDTSISPQPGNDRPQMHILSFELEITAVQFGRLEGAITNVTTDAPILGAVVAVGGQETTSRFDGKYRIVDMIVGSYDVVVNAVDYEEVVAENVFVGENGTVLDVALTPLATSCQANCLRSTQILLQETSNNVVARVLVQDENGNPIEDAEVMITWTLPDSSFESQSRVTNINGRASFQINDGTGTYAIMIDAIVKTGYTFDAENSVISGTIVR